LRTYLGLGSLSKVNVQFPKPFSQSLLRTARRNSGANAYSLECFQVPLYETRQATFVNLFSETYTTGIFGIFGIFGIKVSLGVWHVGLALVPAEEAGELFPYSVSLCMTIH
jgi:hypothetical protein